MNGLLVGAVERPQEVCDEGDLRLGIFKLADVHHRADRSSAEKGAQLCS